MLSEHAVEVLSQPVFVHLALVDERGRPHVSPVWVDVTADREVLVNTAVGRKKERLMQVGAPVALSTTAPGNPYDRVVLRGRVVDRDTEHADDDIDHLAKKYRGLDRYPDRRPGERRVTVVIRPD